MKKFGISGVYTDVNDINTNISLTKDYDDLIKSGFNNEKNIKLFYFPNNINVNKVIEIPIKIENKPQFILPSSSYNTIKISISEKNININYNDKINVVPSSNTIETIYYFNEFNCSLTSGLNVIDHYKFHNDYLSGKIKHLENIINDLKEKTSNSISDTYISNHKIYIPSITELGFGTNNDINEGTEFDIISNNSFNLQKINFNSSYLTRSPNTLGKFELYCIDEFGSLDYTSIEYPKNGLVICLNLYVP
jgi:hypothetical protein